MSLDDRDWYRDIQRQRAGLRPKWNLWRSKRKQQQIPDFRYFPKQFRGSRSNAQRRRDSTYDDEFRQPAKTWHPILIAMVWAVVLLVLFVIFKKFGG